MSIATVEFYLFRQGQKLTIETLMATSDPRQGSMGVRNRASAGSLRRYPTRWPHPAGPPITTLWMDG